jgi:hypothetical protein
LSAKFLETHTPGHLALVCRYFVHELEIGTKNQCVHCLCWLFFGAGRYDDLFCTELLAITTSAYSDHIDLGLAERAAAWERFSLVRLSFLVLLSIILFLG